MKDDTSTSKKMIETQCVKLEELLEKVKICHAQCHYLVQFYSNGIRNMIGTYFQVSKDCSHLWSLYDSKKLRLLSSSLSRLMCSVKAADELLQDCGDESEWKRIALQVSLPLPMMKTYSKFDVLSWARDVIQYASSISKNLTFEWSDEALRYVLKRNHGTDVSLVGAKSPTAVVNDRLVLDRKNLLSQLESGAFLLPQNVPSTSAAEELKLPDLAFAGVVKRRLQQTPDSHSPGSVPTCFQVNHLHHERGRCVSEGGYKKVYEGKWFEQSVAIAIIE